MHGFKRGKIIVYKEDGDWAIRVVTQVGKDNETVDSFTLTEIQGLIDGLYTSSEAPDMCVIKRREKFEY